ncbi:bifunctional nuclease family protein [Aeromicrobium sp. 50.2.37]|uniref:bifunctional nuclease family protein n=1 Tax=Aeromicrobium sp. 50.2.37 TaxID=2969305 RepID=UPI002150506C|nr:bifunctional nuclease family protein [Aeromicrobium sp. 50.2.37]MCR4514897.1 bifunctional nuclease family protein [Aeromicrobium sp. 50.2.37]
MRELDVVGVRVEMPTNQPLVLLRESDGVRYLPIWIGAVEASAIAFAQQGDATPRPLTHELMQRVVEVLGDELDEVRITDVQDGVFYASLVFGSGATVDARPSDSIALALRTGARIVCAEDVLDEAGIASTTDEDQQVERFRAFLDDVEPEDFA